MPVIVSHNHAYQPRTIYARDCVTITLITWQNNIKHPQHRGTHISTTIGLQHCAIRHTNNMNNSSSCFTFAKIF